LGKEQEMTELQKMTELERALLHIKTRADAWAVKEIEKALSQEPITATNNNEPVTIIYPTIVCDDAISRQAVFDLVRSLTRWCVRSEDGKFNNVGLLYDDVMFGIDKLPSVTQKSGTWIALDEGYGPYICSLCEWVEAGKSKYCPNCGARMESEVRNEADN
jgi:hypothetical protein